jgi:hypothetical protein
MKVLAALLLLAILVVVVMATVAIYRSWAANRSPWVLREYEKPSLGDSEYIAFFAYKAGHEPQRLTPWRAADELDFAAIWADDRAAAETKVAHMNLGRRKQIGP